MQGKPLIILKLVDSNLRIDYQNSLSTVTASQYCSGMRLAGGVDRYLHRGLSMTTEGIMTLGGNWYSHLFKIYQ